MTDRILNQLNQEQQQAVAAATGPVLILAGAGSGKTRTLTHRIAYLMDQHLAAPANILALTFTNKAAGEMRQRVAELVGAAAAADMTVGTFHSLGARLLREQHRYHNRTADFTIIDAADSERLVRATLEQQNVNPKEWSPRMLRHRISAAKNAGQQPADMISLAESPADEIAARTYERYQKLLRRENGFDFDDLLLETLRLLQQHEAPRQHYQRRWTFVSVDEYQDTNPTQDTLIRLLAAPEDNICVVGDDYQAIYSWRGAAVDHILQFEKRYPAAKTIYLTQNYRSTQPILTAANQIIQHNTVQKHKKLWTKQDHGTAVVVHACQSDQTEARFVRTRIQTLNDQGIPKKECAVLYRTNAQSRAFEEELVRAGIPYTVIGGLKFYDRAEVKDALALITLAVNPHSSVSLTRIAKPLLKGIGTKSVQRIIAFAQEHACSLIDALQHPECLSERLRASVEPLALLLTEAADSNQAPPALVPKLLKESGYLQYLRRLPDAEDRLENLAELVSVAESYPTIAQLLEAVALLTDLDATDDTSDRVLLMTLHAAKGLEFKAVWLVGLEEGLLPHRSSSDSAADLEEERRLLYVGMTRAKESLTLTRAHERSIHGDRQPQAPSRFLRDLPESILQQDEPASEAHDRVLGLNLTTPEKVAGEPTYHAFEVGDAIMHHHFGQGIVVETSGSTVAAVFEGFGIRTIDTASVTT